MKLSTTIDRREGSILTFVLISIAILALIVGSLVQFSGTEAAQARRQNNSRRAFLIASSALDSVKAEINDPALPNTFGSYFHSTNPSHQGGPQFPVRCNFFRSANRSSDGTSLSYDGVTYQVPSTIYMGPELGDYPVTVQILSSRGHADDLANLYGTGEIVLRVSARFPDNAEGVTRTLTETVRYGITAHKVFDYAYFINNFGWLYGNTITVNGDVRSNRNFDSGTHHPRVNGDIYASEDESGSFGQITGTYNSDSITDWYSRSDTRSRPGSPTISGGADYAPGYDGSPYHFNGQKELTMPYIPSLDGYKEMVADFNTIGTGTPTSVADVTSYEGTLISNPVTTDSNGNPIVNPTFKDHPFLAFWDAAAGSYRQVQVFDNRSTLNSSVTAVKNSGVLVISGDSTHPIVINGPAVVMGDLVIKGMYVGQGTIIADRNIHIAANLQSVAPPSFPATDSTPMATFNTNKQKDLIGLVARGNVVLGNYGLGSFNSGVASYIRPPFTNPYVIDAGDADNGYSNNTISGQPAFSGDYTTVDGGRKNLATGEQPSSGSSDRKYYESTLADSVFHAFATGDNGNLNRIDAVTYNNHLICGRIGNTVINGSMVARDEAIIYSGQIKFNYDERIHSHHGEDRLKIFLPYQLARPKSLCWREGT